MIRVTLLYLIFSLSLFSQGKNTFFGVDLDKDWYSLTNLSAATYFRANLEQNLEYVVGTFSDETIKSLDYSFRNLDYEMYLLFEKDLPQPYNKSLSKASPIFLTGFVSINNESEAQEIFYKTLRLFTKYFGAHDSYNSHNFLGSYSWNNSFRQVNLTYISSGNKRIEFSYMKD